ncbi:hypothetical protein TSAR_006022 [Trichomalopsis sarcophagae]|uniref:Uncharacterized protein n=1 Tax=Trichomalopsis sarcophagae TaxID=543379 RepID=A0A232EVA5_9HYME|nr:hypothetical protein TSAR_006022 [Trichomalopsis sarcophagae]
MLNKLTKDYNVFASDTKETEIFPIFAQHIGRIASKYRTVTALFFSGYHGDKGGHHVSWAWNANPRRPQGHQTRYI